MTKKTGKPFLEVVNNPHKPEPKKTGNGGGSGKSATQRFGDYAIIGGAFYQIKAVRAGPDGQGFVEIQLCDFVCKIMEEVTHDDGLQDQAFVRIEGRRMDGLPLPPVDVPSTKFYSTQGNWINEYYGTLAFVYPGPSKRDNLRAAIQLYSALAGDVPRRQVFKFTGWKQIGGGWCYLTGSGAIKAEGLRQDVQVELGQGHISRYTLPPPFAADEVKAAAGLVSALLNICPGKPQVGAALLAAVARAPLGECHPIDFAVFIHGITGAGKSAITAIPLAFFGDFTARSFPANFSDTDTDMEMKAFQVKDGVFVVDDFKPSVSQSEAAKLHARAERFIRNTGNQAGRGRRGSELQSKAAPYNRSMTFITGEDLPKGQSLLGRLLILELTRADVDFSVLTELQQAASLGKLAGLMAAYLQWLAARMDRLKKDFPEKVISLRNLTKQGNYASSHTRAPEIFANLVAGAAQFTEFLESGAAIDREQAAVLLDSVESGLMQAFSEQQAYQTEQDEVERFLALLRALFASGNAHIACRLNQGPPPEGKRHFLGWREANIGIGEKDWRPTGDCVGWYCNGGDTGPEVWLDQNNAFAAVQKMARDQGETFLMSAPTLWRRMLEKELIIATEKRPNGTKQTTVKRTISSTKRRVMVLSAKLIESES
ncbi:cell wall-binding protein [Methylomicrobium sp. Wu6]|uniref:cell wall-binding protein n=1 Tax=Methylomicrobium sp. Wu6 TaxID=3107928 RepID=UPI002DD61CB7|nr:cell wall-binding protein [Methylomicrobium sp. Wu6]MEC4747960.1 cell wall-binding protein [Methylomicrobium sp. Wu6]